MMPRPRTVPEDAVTDTAAAEVLYHFGLGGYRPGGFRAALLDAWDHADFVSTARLALAFPDLGAALMILGDDWSGADRLRDIVSLGPR